MASLRAISLVTMLTLSCSDGSDGNASQDGSVADAGADGGDEGPTWTTVTQDLDHVLLSVWGFSPNDIWFVGGGFDAGPGRVLHLTDGKWENIETATDNTFWWVWGCSPEDLWFVGEGGTLVRWESGSTTAYDSPVEATYFGVWGSSCDDVWAVGGDVTGGATDVLAHFQGDSWELDTPPGPFNIAYFKVWGTAANDVFAVGQSPLGGDGIIAHYDGKVWSPQPSGADGYLFTVWGSGPTNVYAVGGQVGPATVIRYDGDTWNPVDEDFGSCGAIVNGVYIQPNGDGFVVGMSGLKWNLSSGTWTPRCFDEPLADLHGVWGDDAGNAFSVGGDYITRCAGSCRGTIAYYGDSPPPAP